MGKKKKLTVLRETLDQCSDDHNERAAHDGPASAKLVVDDGDKGQRQNGSEGVCCRDDALERSLRVAENCVLVLARPHNE